MRDVSNREWKEFWEGLRKQITKARCGTVPLLTPTDLADKVKKTPTTVYSWENGKRRPTLESLFMIAAVTGKKLVIKFE